MKDRPFRLRLAEMGDFAACLPLFSLLYHGDIGPDFKSTFERFIDSKDCTVLLAEHSNNVIGILVGSYRLDIDWEGNIARIDALIVDKAFRRMGIGSRLVSFFVDKSRNDGCKAIKSRINIENVIAQSLHQSLGFERANTYEYFLNLD